MAESRSPAEDTWQGPEYMEQEDHLEALAAELVASQDQFLALLELAVDLRQTSRLEDAMDIATRSAVRLSGARSALMQIEFTNGLQLSASFPTGRCNLTTAQSESENVHLYRILEGGSHTLSFPIDCDRDASGTLTLQFASGRLVGSPVKKAVQMVAAQTSAALDSIILQEQRIATARLHAELELAHRVQTSLMPDEPEDVSGLEVAVRSSPAREVGGDLYAFGSGPNEEWQALVGDVAGKGVPAALMMAMMQTTYSNTRHLPSALHPHAVIDFLNAALYEDMSRAGLFATAFCVQYSAATETLEYANAGHAPVILKSNNAPARLLTAQDMPVGVLPTMHSGTATAPFGPGDILLVGSDGLTDASSPDGMLFGLERLMECLDHLSSRSAGEIRDGVIAAIAAFSAGHEQIDDQTVIVLKRRAS